MGLESTVIILFQSYVGGLYLRIVFITCAFMLGAAAGALIELKSYQTGQQKPVFRQMLILGICLLAVFGIIALQPIQFLTSAIILTVLFLAGILSGTVFPRLVCLLEQAKQIQLTKSAGNIYAWDILGACLGIYLFSGLIIPIFGLLSAIIILSLICAGLIIVNFHIR
jgi:predicted membrane-bound spermidine synthase